MTVQFLRMSSINGLWKRLESAWEAELKEFGEDNLETYLGSTYSIKNDYLETGKDDDCLYCLDIEGEIAAFCRLNCRYIPGYTGKVVRVRHVTVSPSYDLGDREVDDYVSLIAELLDRVLEESKEGPMQAPHVKFHLKSPADRLFFATLADHLTRAGAFESVDMRGSWLYITK